MKLNANFKAVLRERDHSVSIVFHWFNGPQKATTERMYSSLPRALRRPLGERFKEDTECDDRTCGKDHRANTAAKGFGGGVRGGSALNTERLERVQS